MTDNNELHYDANQHQLICSGEWTLNQIKHLNLLFGQIKLDRQIKTLLIEGEGIKKMDSAGAWLLSTWKLQLMQQGIQVKFANFKQQYQTLLAIIEQQLPESPPPERLRLSWVQRIGKDTVQQASGLRNYLHFIGRMSEETLRIIKKPTHIRFGSIAAIIYKTGYQALPIVALLSLMIGVVLTYQMGLQLRNYGANIYIVDLLGLSILREFGPLLTAILIAGRTGSAFTAELGMMKINQEIDALNTMGITPGELLILPRIIGLVIALPLLTMWSNIFGILGGMIVSHNMLSISWYDFIDRFPTVIPLKTLIIGLGKTPVFALLIASVGCFQGMNVKGSADSVGRNTTRSVVLGIFFIIVADAIFSVIFSKLKL